MSRDLQSIHAKSFVNRLHSVFQISKILFHFNAFTTFLCLHVKITWPKRGLRRRRQHGSSPAKVAAAPHVRGGGGRRGVRATAHMAGALAAAMACLPLRSESLSTSPLGLDVLRLFPRRTEPCPPGLPDSLHDTSSPLLRQSRTSPPPLSTELARRRPHHGACHCQRGSTAVQSSDSIQNV